MSERIDFPRLSGIRMLECSPVIPVIQSWCKEEWLWASEGQQTSFVKLLCEHFFGLEIPLGIS